MTNDAATVIAIEHRTEGMDVVELMKRRHPENPKGHDIPSLIASLRRFGFAAPVLLCERTGKIAAGHGRTQALMVMRQDPEQERPRFVGGQGDVWLAPVVRGWSSVDDDELLAYVIADNRQNELGGWDEEMLAKVGHRLAELPGGLGLVGTGFDKAQLDEIAARMAGGPGGDGGGGAAAQEAANRTLSERFLVPPFSVLDARQGYWQERKRAWLALGIRSEEGRPTNLLKMSDTVLESTTKQRQTQRSSPRTLSGGQMPDFYVRKTAYEAEHGEISTREFEDLLISGAVPGYKKPNQSTPASVSGSDPAFFTKKSAYEATIGREVTTAEFIESGAYVDGTLGGTSIFDPVLCEIAYRWWCPEGGQVLDPFAGGSVRGVVAARLGLHYTGIDLRSEQVASNEEQQKEIGGPGSAEWVVGDAQEAPMPEAADLIFTCPPYFDLEQYSDDPADLSNADDYPTFLTAYQAIIARACGVLTDDRFACVVVGDIRDTAGIYRGFVPDTIRAFEAAGLSYYNEGILVSPVGSLALRAGRIFSGARKLAKGHQNVLVFVKGDPKRAANACAPVEIPDLTEMFGETIVVATT